MLRSESTATAAAFAYNAFVSYSHAADGALAPALRAGLQRFTTPWGAFRLTNPVRSVRVFQDQASLSANPALWPTIERALASAEWFILLGSPDAASSPWVGKEVDFWRRNRTIENLLIVQTDGDVVWNAAANDFDWAQTTALPRELAQAFNDEPRWIDARWARTADHKTLRDPRFRDLVAELAAPLRTVPKDELIGEDIRQHRRLTAWRNVAFAVLSLLLVGALVSAGLALWQRNLSEQRLAIAQLNKSRALASVAEIESEQGSPAKAIRLALAALPMRLDSPERYYARKAEGALLNSVQALHERRRFPHENWVSSVAYSPDGRTLATGLYDNTARLGDLATGKEIAALRGHESAVTSVAFSPDGRRLSTGSGDSTARLWEVATGKVITVLRGHEHIVGSVAFSPDGRMLATGSLDDTARLWDVATAKEIAALRGHERAVSSVAFSPDGRTLATGSSDSTARLWEVATGKLIAVLRGHEGLVTSVAFSPDGRTLATGSADIFYISDRTARLWEVATGKEIAVLRGHEKIVTSVAFSPDGRMLATGSGNPFLSRSSDSTVRLWDATSGKEIAVLRGRKSFVTSVAFSPDGRTLAIGFGSPFNSSGNLGLLSDVATGKVIAVLRGHEDGVNSVAFSPDGRTLATGSRDSTARLWDVASGKVIAVLRGHERIVRSVAFSPDGRTLATGSVDKTARLWDVASGKEITVLRGHGDAVFPIAFSPDGQMLATGSADKTARLWEVATGEEIAVLRGHENDVGSVAFSPDGRMLATGSKDNTARLWPVGQYLVNLACARVNGLPLSERDKERFGITDEWCAPEVSGALRAKLGVDQSDTAHPPVIAR